MAKIYKGAVLRSTIAHPKCVAQICKQLTMLGMGNTWVCDHVPLKNKYIHRSIIRRPYRLVVRHFTTSIDLRSLSLYHPFP